MPSVNFGRGSSVAPSKAQREPHGAPIAGEGRVGQRLDGLRVKRVADGHVLAREGLARAILDLGDERRVVVVVGRFCVFLCVMVRRCLILGCCGSLRCLFEFGGVVDVIVVRLLRVVLRGAAWCFWFRCVC